MRHENNQNNLINNHLRIISLKQATQTHPYIIKKEYRKRPERPRPTIPTVHEQQQEKRCMYNGHPIPDNALPRPDNHSQWNDRLQCREPQYG